jgi:hypothetical protein
MQRVDVMKASSWRMIRVSAVPNAAMSRRTSASTRGEAVGRRLGGQGCEWGEGRQGCRQRRGRKLLRRRGRVQRRSSGRRLRPAGTRRRRSHCGVAHAAATRASASPLSARLRNSPAGRSSSHFCAVCAISVTARLVSSAQGRVTVSAPSDSIAKTCPYRQNDLPWRNPRRRAAGRLQRS